MKYHGARLGKLLIREGMCPNNAIDVELHIPVSGAVFIRYDVLLDSADVPKLLRALGSLLDESNEGFAGLPESQQPSAGGAG